jgi:phytoene dehydrogenase-like protein
MNTYDIVIIGSGHNSLIAAAYLAKAGKKILILERNDEIGGATVSRRIFPDFDAQLSEYSYLISLLPKKIIDDLNLEFKTERRETGSYTPDGGKALLISNVDETLTRQSFRDFTGSDEEYRNYRHYLELTHTLAHCLWKTFLEPLESRNSLKKSLKTREEHEAWDAFIERPLGEFLESKFTSDAVRGLIFTDGKIGVFTDAHNQSLLQNRTFLYHIIGNETGEWQVPIGGMGKLISELQKLCQAHGVEMITNANAIKIEMGDMHEITCEKNGEKKKVMGRIILANMAMQKLEKLIDASSDKGKYSEEQEGSVLKINMLLRKLPILKNKRYTSKQAFSGTFHINEGYGNMEQNYQNAKNRKHPKSIAGEMYCHSLTDPSILSGELNKQGYQTLTLFGLDMPYRLFTENNEAAKQTLTKKYLDAISEYLEEPIETYMAVDGEGNPCISTKSPIDIEHDLSMPMGNIFQSPLSWPFVDDESRVGTRGIETPYPNILLCGASARRGGGVSGIPGYHAAMKILESEIS